MPTNIKKPIPAARPAAPAAATEAWAAKIVFAGGREWAFSCDGVVVNELRRAMLDGRPAHLVYAGTEAIVNPAHVASVELQRQPAGG